MAEVTLHQVLQAREDRVALQQTLLQRHHRPLVCFTMNIAGPVKTSPLIERAFDFGLKELERRLPGDHILAREISIAATGCQAMFAIDMDAASLKEICMSIEESSSIGRLFDMDVLDESGIKLERPTLRGCIVCGAPGRNCAARRLHSVSELQIATREIIESHFASEDRIRIAALAVQSLLDEVHTTPKPGLVDCRNNGSHSDMNLSTFVASANALEPYFRKCVEIGQNTASSAATDTFALLRPEGMAAESAMYRVTGGVNTHKGAIYTIGILCGCLGRLWTAEHPIAETQNILAECTRMTEASVASDFASIDGSTAGQRLYLSRGLTGIRGEVSLGLPSVAKIALPAYEKYLHQGLSKNDAGTITLLHLIATVEDTNLHHRGGAEGAAYAAESARRLLENRPFPSSKQIEALDDEFIARNLSPGGCADLLAVTYFLHELEIKL